MKKNYLKPEVRIVKVEIEQGFAASAADNVNTVGIQSFSEDDANDGWAF